MRRLPIHVASGVTYTANTVVFLVKHGHLADKDFHSRDEIGQALAEMVDETVRTDMR